MIFDLQVALVLEARDATAATAVRDEVIGVLGHPVTERLPVEEYTKFPGCWLAVMNLTPFDDDPVDVITRLSSRLAATGWSVKDHGHGAEALWKHRDTGETTFVNPAVRWANIEAFPPLADQEPAEVEELVPEGPEISLSSDQWSELLSERRDRAE